jgi:hypothetical protein
MKLIILFVLLVSSTTLIYAQKNYWYFGDSAGIVFENGIAIPDTNGILSSIEGCATITDSNGYLEFYTSGYKSWDNNHNLIQGTDSLFLYPSNSSYYTTSNFYGNTSNDGVVILPFDSIYYVINNNQLGFIPDNSTPDYDTIFQSLYYYRILKNGNVYTLLDQKPILIGDKFPFYTEAVVALKHGNGRDWWLITHKTDTTNTFIKYLITPNNIYGPYAEQIGSSNYIGSGLNGEYCVSIDNNKLFTSDNTGLIDVFDFNRCNGQLKNFVNIRQGSNIFLEKNLIYGLSVSPNKSKVYASGWKRLYQFSIDTNTNALLNTDTIWNNPYYPSYFGCDTQNCIQIGPHELGPDGKIYIASAPYSPELTSINDSVIYYLSIIENPDESVCNFSPYSFSLRRRSFFSLPNMPNYKLGELEGSACDTLTSTQEIKLRKSIINIYPNPAHEVLNIEILNGSKPSSMKLVDITGREIILLNQTKPTQQVNIQSLSKGIYLLKVEHDNGEREVKKIVKQ